MIPIQGALVSFSFSGTWSRNMGVIQAGDSFSGTATWDTNSFGLDGFPFNASLSSLNFTMPAADGLSVASIANSKLLFTPNADYYLCTSLSCFGMIQFAETTNGDANVYGFLFGAPPLCIPGPCNAYATYGARSLEVAGTYVTEGPTLVDTPEPEAWSMILSGLGLLAGLRLYRRIV